MTKASPQDPHPLLQRLQAEASWLLDPSLKVCVVGSTALAEACRRQGLDGPTTSDLDLAWAVPIEQGDVLLDEHDCAIKTTDANRGRGTLAIRIGEERVELTSFRGDGLLEDLSRRDMTIGAVAWRLHDDTIHDPHEGLDHWRSKRMVAVGDANERVQEHPIRWIRYLRKAHTLGFEVDTRIRRVDLDPVETFASTPAEAIAAEFRYALEDLASPGRFFAELYEMRLLQHLAPEIALQFDGRPAGPQHHHPEIGQGLHLILALEWIAARTQDLPPADAYAARFATLCHDLGKGLTKPEDFPSHRGHEGTGHAPIDSLCERLPSLADVGTKRLAHDVCELHLLARGFDNLRKGTIAKIYDKHFRSDSVRLDLFALAVAADSAGRLDREDEGDSVYARVLADLEWMRSCCASVDARALREQFSDIDAFRSALHEARAKSLRR